MTQPDNRKLTLVFYQQKIESYPREYVCGEGEYLSFLGLEILLSSSDLSNDTT